MHAAFLALQRRLAAMNDDDDAPIEELRELWRAYLPVATEDELYNEYIVHPAYGANQMLGYFEEVMNAWADSPLLQTYLRTELLPELRDAKVEYMLRAGEADPERQVDHLYELVSDHPELLSMLTFEQLCPAAQALLTKQRHVRLTIETLMHTPNVPRMFELMRHGDVNPYFSLAPGEPTLLQRCEHIPAVHAHLLEVIAAPRLAVAMSQHPRLGAQSGLQTLPPELLARINTYSY